MKQLSPGVYDDGEGGLHLDFGEMLRASGAADTPQNRAMLEAALREQFSGPITVTVTDEPLVRDATEAEQRAALVAAARRMVADGYGHECSEWLVNGRCELCGHECRQ